MEQFFHMPNKNYYVNAKDMREEWMKIYHWNQLSQCEPCDYSTILYSLSADYDLNYMNHTLELSGCISETLGTHFKMIATKLSTSPCFINYSFKDEMIGDALLNMTRYADRYNPAKSKNIFSYFTKIAFNAFIVRIKKEEKSRNIISIYQQENFIRLMEEQTEGQCFISIDPEVTIEETIKLIEQRVKNEESEWN